MYLYLNWLLVPSFHSYMYFSCGVEFKIYSLVQLHMHLAVHKANGGVHVLSKRCKFVNIHCLWLKPILPTVTDLAYQKPSAFSSEYDSVRVAAQGNDGDPDTMFVTSNEDQPWWGVDLGEVYPVDTVGIINRKTIYQSQCFLQYTYILCVSFGNMYVVGI